MTTRGGGQRAVIARLSIPLAGLLATALLTWMAMHHPGYYHRIMVALIQWPGGEPFIDWAVTPTALSCWARGVAVYLPNDCTPTFNYSPAFLLLPAPPGGPFWNIVFGFAIALGFFAALALLAPPRSRGEFAVRLLATLSPAVALGIERGNVDLILFVALLVGSLVIARRGAGGVAGYGVFIIAALLKFYPVAALFLLVRERPARFVGIGLVMLAGAAWLFLAFRAELAVILGNLPDSGEWAREFKGRALADGLSKGLARIPALRPHDAGLAAALRLAIMLLMAGAAAAAWRACAARGVRLPERQAMLLPMVMAATVTLFCFVVGQNFTYRGVYLLPVLPGLFVVARAAPPAIGRIVTASCLVMVAAMWMPAIRWSAATLGLWDRAAVRGVLWLGYQLGWWWIATVLCAVMLGYLADSTIGGALLRIVPPRYRPARAGRLSTP